MSLNLPNFTVANAGNGVILNWKRTINRKVDISESYAEHGNMKVQIQVSCLNGTEFSIAYSCTSAGNAAQDAAKPSPVERTITSDGFKEVILNIPV